MEIVEFDFDTLRKDLVDYFGSAIASNPFAVADVVNLDNVNDYKLIEIAYQNGFNLDNYIIKDNTR